MQTAEETTQAVRVSRQLKQTSGWASVGVARTGIAPRSPGECGGVGWSWSGSNTLGPLCVLPLANILSTESAQEHFLQPALLNVF